MTPQERARLEDAAYAVLKRLTGTTDDLDYGELFDALTSAGFSISLDAVRDHTNCETCHNRANGLVCSAPGAPVVWSVE